MPRDDDGGHLARVFQAIYAVVRRVPRGRVATYGQVAELAGFPGGARAAGAAMRGSSAARLPWQRIVGKRGPTSARIAIHDPVGAAVQRQLLEREGVEVSDAGTIDLRRFGWLPGDDRPRPGRRRRAAAAVTTPGRRRTSAAPRSSRRSR
ncbi:MAG: MGMT family protein [Kofleriaceae bacterium]|nr:MGMT family protein [Kofleriaceae bacterium]MCB9575008.1 MGMT family protein [Kofleriaceae bacterium]